MFTLLLQFVFYLLKMQSSGKREILGLEVFVFWGLVQVKGCTHWSSTIKPMTTWKGDVLLSLGRWSNPEVHGCLPGMTETGISLSCASSLLPLPKCCYAPA